MRRASSIVLVAALASLVLAGLSPLVAPKSQNPCASCHANFYQHLDVLEGDAGNILPQSVDRGATAQVKVVIKNECNAARFNVLTSVAATLSSDKGLFSVQTPTVYPPDIARGATVSASWTITGTGAGTDTLQVTVSARNTHYNCQFTDSYSPAPSLTVVSLIPNQPPTISLLAPQPGLRLTGGYTKLVTWSAHDEDLSKCTVALFHSTDDFSSSNVTVASGLQAGGNHAWSVPSIDSPSVKLKAIIRDPEGLLGEAVSAAPFTIDSTPPAVSQVQPADGEVNVSGSAFLVVRFSERVIQSSAQAAFGILPDPGSVAWSWDAESRTMTATHAPFEQGTVYDCQLSAGLKDDSEPGNVNQDRFSWSFTTSVVQVPVPSAVLLAPSGGERFYQDDPVAVSWSASGGTGPLSVNLSCSERGSPGPFTLLASDLPNTGSFSLKAPRMVSDACLLMMTVRDQNWIEASALAGGSFSIAERIAIRSELLAPDSLFRPNETVEITWTAGGGHGELAVSLFFKAGPSSPKELVAANLSRDGSFTWTVPEANTTEALLFLNATDGWGGSEGISSLRFTIEPVYIPPPPPPPPPPLNHPPVIRFGIEDDRTLAKMLMTFTSAGTFDQDGDALHYIWDFGDGTAPLNTTSQRLTHVFLSAGKYLVTLTVEDGRDRSSQTMEVAVGEAGGLPASEVSDWPQVSLAGLIIILGFVGILYAAVGSRSQRGTRPEREPPRAAAPGPGPGTLPPDRTARAAAPEPQARAGAGPMTILSDDPACRRPVRGLLLPTPEEVRSCLPRTGTEPVETVEMESAVDWNGGECLGCGLCARKCPAGIIRMEDKRPSIDHGKCIACGACVKACPRAALSLKGTGGKP